MGDLFICEDGKGDQFMDVVTSNGQNLKWKILKAAVFSSNFLPMGVLAGHQRLTS